jgi:hypothetical protein
MSWLLLPALLGAFDCLLVLVLVLLAELDAGLGDEFVAPGLGAYASLALELLSLLHGFSFLTMRFGFLCRTECRAHSSKRRDPEFFRPVRNTM